MIIQRQSQFAFFNAFKRWLKWAFGGLPTWLILPGLQRVWSKKALYRNATLHADSLERGDIVDVVVDESSLLRKSLELPVVAKSNLQKAVDMHMRQTLPSSGQNLLWRARTVMQTKQKIILEIFVIKLEAVQSISKLVKEVGAHVRTIQVIENGVKPFVDNRRKTDRFHHLWIIMNVLLALFVLASLLWIEWRETQSLSAQLKLQLDQKSAISERLVKLRQDSDQKEQLINSIDADISLFASEYRRLPILLELTEKLPDETWLSEVSIEAQEMRLSGFSSEDMSETISQIRSIELVDAVIVDGPVIFDSLAQKNRFDLVVVLKAAPGKL